MCLLCLGHVVLVVTIKHVPVSLRAASEVMKSLKTQPVSLPYCVVTYRTLIQGQNHLGDCKIFMMYGTRLMAVLSANCHISLLPLTFH